MVENRPPSLSEEGPDSGAGKRRVVSSHAFVEVDGLTVGSCTRTRVCTGSVVYRRCKTNQELNLRETSPNLIRGTFYTDTGSGLLYTYPGMNFFSQKRLYLLNS